MCIRCLPIVFVTLFVVDRVIAEEEVRFATNPGPLFESMELTSACESGCLDACVDSGCFDECYNACACPEGCCFGGFQIEGWLDAGFLLNGHESPSGFHGPYNQTDRHEGALYQALPSFRTITRQ